MGKDQIVTARETPLPMQFSWPHDEDGRPMALICMQASELIGLPKFSNVTVGPAAVWRFVKDDAVVDGLGKTAVEVETIVAQERQVVLESIQVNAE